LKTPLAPAFGAAAVAALLYVLYRVMGPVGLALGMPLLGAVLARPLVDLVAGCPRFVSRLAMRKVEGRYVEYRGMSLDIHIDAHARCWISTHDIRKLVSLPADPVLRRLAPSQCGELGDPPQCRITVEGLAQVLAKATQPDVTKFCHWLEVDVARPARNRRERGPATR
jgi:hypothetical protein